MLITERAGRLRLMHDGRLTSANIGGVPPVDTRTQDGLMDLALHPRFAQNQILYFTYSKPGERGDTTALATEIDGLRDELAALTKRVDSFEATGDIVGLLVGGILLLGLLVAWLAVAGAGCAWLGLRLRRLGSSIAATPPDPTAAGR